jgi:uncharacterized protein YndB with AHSA1/START domain/DNA-binding transcriptional ArsR family regulator
MDPSVLTALGQQNRLAIVELLNQAPRPVGEIAKKLGLRQPQATKHLQSLQRAGLVSVYPLGQRRIYALRRQGLQEIGEWLDSLATRHPSETVLNQYTKAIKAGQRRTRKDPHWAIGYSMTFTRQFATPPATVWAHWTRPALIRRWWSPEHFEVVHCALELVVGGPLEIVMQEGDGTRYPSRGRFIRVKPPTHLRFELGPLAPDGSPLLLADHDVTLKSRGDGTNLSLAVRITHATADALPAVAGLRLGWDQLLNKLGRSLSQRSRRPIPMREV